MSFVKVQQSVVSHRKTLRLARLLSLDRYAVVGRLVALWAWCLDNALDGCLTFGGDDIDAEVLADVMGWSQGMGKPAELLEGLLTVGFLDVDAQDGHLHIHDWYEHMGKLIERREQDADRKCRQREREREHEREHEREDREERDGIESAGRSEAVSAHVTRMSRGCHADVTRMSRARVE
jgi:hypothetical protein